MVSLLCGIKAHSLDWPQGSIRSASCYFSDLTSFLYHSCLHSSQVMLASLLFSQHATHASSWGLALPISLNPLSVSLSIALSTIQLFDHFTYFHFKLSVPWNIISMKIGASFYFIRCCILRI